jgi:hypothetical protein
MEMASRTVASVSSTKVSDGLYVVTDAYVRIYDFFETSPLFPGEPLIVPTAPAEEKRPAGTAATDPPTQ